MAQPRGQKAQNAGYDAYPSLPEDLAAPQGELPGELAPMVDSETEIMGQPEPLPKDLEEMPSMQDFLDNYTPPFQPLPASQYPVNKEPTPSRSLTKPRGTVMAQFLYNRSVRGPAPRTSREAVAMADAQEMKNSIVTTAPEALRQALNIIGVASERNPTGLSVSLSTARQVIVGKNQEDIPGTEEAEFRAAMERGDDRIDKKKIRQFVNYDGSITYEVLNDDKSIMSRFTLGEYKGQKVFVQGGYSAYAQTLRKLAPQLAASQAKSSEFDEIRKKAGG